MEKKTNLTVTITGSCEDENGEMHIVDAKYENLDFVFLNAFKFLPNDQCSHEVATMGGSSGYMWSKIIKAIIETVDEDGDFFLVILKRALTELTMKSVSADAFEEKM